MWLYVNSFRLVRVCVRVCVCVCVFGGGGCLSGRDYVMEVKCMSWNNKEETETTCTVQQ